MLAYTSLALDHLLTPSNPTPGADSARTPWSWWVYAMTWAPRSHPYRQPRSSHLLYNCTVFPAGFVIYGSADRLLHMLATASIPDGSQNSERRRAVRSLPDEVERPAQKDSWGLDKH